VDVAPKVEKIIMAAKARLLSPPSQLSPRLQKESRGTTEAAPLQKHLQGKSAPRPKTNSKGGGREEKLEKGGRGGACAEYHQNKKMKRLPAVS